MQLELLKQIVKQITVFVFQKRSVRGKGQRGRNEKEAAFNSLSKSLKSMCERTMDNDRIGITMETAAKSFDFSPRFSHDE